MIQDLLLFEFQAVDSHLYEDEVHRLRALFAFFCDLVFYSLHILHASTIHSTEYTLFVECVNKRNTFSMSIASMRLIRTNSLTHSLTHSIHVPCTLTVEMRPVKRRYDC